MHERLYSDIWVNSFLLALRECGEDLDSLLDKPGAHIIFQKKASQLYNYDQLQLLARLIIQEFSDLSIVLKTNSLPHHGSFKFIDHLSVFCSNYESAIRKFYHNLNSIVPFELFFNITDWGDVFAFEMKYKDCDDRFACAMSPLEIALFLDRSAYLTGTKLEPKEIELQIEEPKGSYFYKDYFGCSVQYGRPYSRILLDSKILNMELPSSEPLLAGFIEDNLFDLFHKLQFDDHLVAEVERIIRSGLFSNCFDLDHVAQKLGMSRRVLQQRLSSLGSSYSEILKEVRLNFTIRFIREQRGTIAELSEMLGFTEPVSFYRAFKQWTGKTLKGYFKDDYESRQ